MLVVAATLSSDGLCPCAPTGDVCDAQITRLRRSGISTSLLEISLVTALFGIGNSSNAFNLVTALISYPAGFLSDRWGRKNMLLASFVIFFVAYLGFALTRNVILIAALFVFTGCIRGYSAQSARPWRRISCQSTCAPARWVGATPRSACSAWWRASRPDCYGIVSATAPCFSAARHSRWWSVLPWSQ
jgi:MFS family permease